MKHRLRKGDPGLCLAAPFMIYAVRYIPDGHSNPEVTVWFWVSGQFSDKDVPPHIVRYFFAARHYC